MRVDLNDRQRAEHHELGKLTGADGRAYARRGTRAKRRVADELVSSGTPLVLEMYSSGQFEWFTGDEARQMWAEVRPYVVSTAPTSPQLAKHERWTAGIWESDAGTRLLYLTGSC